MGKLEVGGKKRGNTFPSSLVNKCSLISGSVSLLLPMLLT